MVVHNAYNHLGYTNDRPVNSENSEMRYMQDRNLTVLVICRTVT